MGYGEKSKKDKAAERGAAQAANKKQAEDDAGWEEGDKHAKKKLDRAADKDAKEADRLRKLQEKKELEEADNATISQVKPTKKKDDKKGKLTHAQIQQNLALMSMASNAKAKPKKTQCVEQPALLPNMNRTEDLDASTVEQALKALEISEAGKKMTFKEFEAEVMDKVKLDYPGLKRSALLEKVNKLWDRSPLNPKNEKK